MKAGLTQEYSISNLERPGSVIDYCQPVFHLQVTLCFHFFSAALILGFIFSYSRTRLPFFQTASVLTLSRLMHPLMSLPSAFHLSSARCRSWALPVPRLGAGLWWSTASRHPSGGDECHHDVSRRYPPICNILKLKQSPGSLHLWQWLSEHVRSVDLPTPSKTPPCHHEYLSLPQDESVSYMKPELKKNLWMEWKWQMQPLHIQLISSVCLWKSCKSQYHSLLTSGESFVKSVVI